MTEAITQTTTRMPSHDVCSFISTKATIILESWIIPSLPRPDVVRPVMRTSILCVALHTMLPMAKRMNNGQPSLSIVFSCPDLNSDGECPVKFTNNIEDALKECLKTRAQANDDLEAELPEHSSLYL